MKIDAYDLSILDVLAANAEVTLSELAETVHLSRPSVTRRVEKLRERGILAGSRAGVAFEKLGWSVQAFVYVKSPTKTSYELLDDLLDRPEVLNVSVVVGDGVMLVEIIARDREHLHRFLDSLMEYGDTTTHYVLRQHRSTMRLKARLRKTDEFLVPEKTRVG